jgi:hypothetical protein
MMVPEMNDHHSAGRLIAALDNLKRSVPEAQSELSLIELIAMSNGLTMDDPAVLGIAQALLDLPRVVAKDIARIDAPQARVAETGLKILVDTLSPTSLNRPWCDLSRELELNTAQALAISDLLLSRRSSEKPLDRRELSQLADNARQLLMEVRTSDLIPDDVKRFVESALVSLLSAIDEYWLRGAAVVETAIDAVLGRALREGQFMKKDGVSRGVLRRLGELVTGVAMVVALANDIDTLPKTVRDVVDGVAYITHDHSNPGGNPDADKKLVEQKQKQKQGESEGH